MVNLLPQAPLPRLLLGYASALDRGRQALFWLLDERLAAILRGGREPAIMAIRLAWWRDALVADDPNKGRGEPLIEAFRANGLSAKDRAAIGRLIEGWSILTGTELTRDELLDYGHARGGGLFALLSGSDTEATKGIGAIWALWDLAAYASDTKLAEACISIAATHLEGARETARHMPKPLRLAFAVAERDVQRGHVPDGGFRLRHYGTLLAASLRRHIG